MNSMGRPEELLSMWSLKRKLGYWRSLGDHRKGRSAKFIKAAPGVYLSVISSNISGYGSRAEQDEAYDHYTN